MSKAIAKQETSIATAEKFTGTIGTIGVAGLNETGSNLSRVVLFQGTPEEEAMYGQFKRGEFLDTLETRSLGTSIKIVPMFAFGSWSVWEKGSKVPVQTWTREQDVPKHLLEWTEENGHRTPPQAQMSVNLVCCIEGEPWPYLMVFKRTGLKAYMRQIAPMESRRAAIGKGSGLYELSGKDDKNGAGQAFKRLVARPAGEPNSETVTLCMAVLKAEQAFRAKAAAVAEESTPAGAYDPDAD